MCFINIYNFKLHYQIYGTGIPLLFIHGLGSSQEDWYLQIDFFKKFYKVIVYDLPGHGKSNLPYKNLTLYDLSCLTKIFLKKLDIHEKIIVIGISLGGMLAYEFAVNFNFLIKKLVIINCLPELKAHNLADKLKFFKRYLFIKFFGLKPFSKIISKNLFPLKTQKKLYLKFIENWNKNKKNFYLQYLKSIYNWSVKKQLFKITCSTLIISAEFDYYFFKNKKSYIKYLNGKTEFIEIKNSRHATPIDQADIFNSILKNFINEEI